jgi:hypothetical protein
VVSLLNVLGHGVTLRDAVPGEGTDAIAQLINFALTSEVGDAFGGYCCGGHTWESTVCIYSAYAVRVGQQRGAVEACVGLIPPIPGYVGSSVLFLARLRCLSSSSGFREAVIGSFSVVVEPHC